MNKSLLTTLQSQKIEKEHLSQLRTVPRAAADALLEGLKSSLIKVVTGPRRAGKSTLIMQVLKGSRFAYINFEDDALLSLAPDGDQLVEAAQSVYGAVDYWFFDEIQLFKNWESFLNKLHRRGFNLLVTGSNSKLLSGELASSLTGRHTSLELLPFSFTEFCTSRNAGVENWDLFKQYLTYGGFPEVVAHGYDSGSYLQDLFSAVILKDIVLRHKIRNPSALNDLCSLLSNSVAGRFSARSLERALGGRLSVATIQKYLTYVSDAYLFRDLQRFHFKTRERQKADRKIYMLDNGFVSACSQKVLSEPANLLENLVFIELMRRGYAPNLHLFYYQTTDGKEVDFLVRERSGAITLFQVCHSLDSPKTRERELSAIGKAGAEVKASRLCLLTYKEQDLISLDGATVEVFPVSVWLGQNATQPAARSSGIS